MLDVSVRHVFAYGGTPLQLVDEHTVVYVSGNTLHFTSTVTNKQHVLLRPKARQIVAFDCNWRTATIALTSREPNAEIQLLSYPEKKPRGKLPAPRSGSMVMEYSHLVFSRCGRMLVSVHRAATNADGATLARSPSKGVKQQPMGQDVQTPQRILCVWDVDHLSPVKGLAHVEIKIDVAFLSFDPSNSDHLIVGGADGLKIWKIYRAKDSSLLRSSTVSMKALSTSYDSVLSDESTDGSFLDEQRGWLVCHAWTRNSRVLVANKAGEVVIVDVTTASVVQIIESATRHDRMGISGIVCTSETVVICYNDGQVLWLNDATFEVLQRATIPIRKNIPAFAGDAAADSNTSELCTIMHVTPSPNYSKIYVGTQDGGIFELKTTVMMDEEEDDEGMPESLSGTSNQDHHGQHDSHLVVPCGSFPIGPVLACAPLTPCGGMFLSDVCVASGAANGRIYLWNIGNCRLVAEVSVASLFAKSAAAPAAHAGSVDGTGTQAIGSAGLSSPPSTEQLPGDGSDEDSPSIVITALAGRSADPVLMIGDHMGRLRAVCASKIVGSNGSIELIPLHSLQLVTLGVPLDILELHPTQAILLAASTQDNAVFILSMDHEKHFQVIAYITLLEPDEYAIDVKWSVPAHNRNSISFTCYSSRGLFYVARYQADLYTATSGSHDDGVSAVELRAKVVAFGEDMLTKCANLKFLHGAPMSMMLATAPTTNDLTLMKYQELVLDPTEKICILSKVLAPDVHDNGIATMALYDHTLKNGAELVATAGMNGAISIWMVTYGGGNTSVQPGEKEWQLEDVQAAKKKTIIVHSGPVVSLTFLTIGEDVYLVSVGNDGCVFMLDIRIPDDMVDPPTEASMEAAQDAQNMNPLFINIATFAKYDDSFNPEQEHGSSKPFLQVLGETEATRARNRVDQLKDQTRSQLNDLEVKLKYLLSENEKLPEAERLPRDAFVLNTEWRDQLLKQNKDRANTVRENILKEVAKMNIIRERMKQEFWDSATVNGVQLCGLTPPPEGSSAATSELFVYNFPMRRLSKKEELLAKKVELLRLIEYEHHQQEAASVPVAPVTALARFQNTLPPNLQWLVDAGIHHPSLKKWMAATLKANAATAGSSDNGLSQPSTVNYNDMKSYHLVYHPAAIYTRKQQRTQIHLLKSFVRFLVVEFNQEFNALVKLKEGKMEEIEAKNARIDEICGELNSTYKHFRPQWAPSEVAASILDVQPEEMTQTVYETEDMRNKREKEAAERLELERQRQKDDVAGRALQDMMNGTLEVKKENLVNQSMEKEPWMLEIPADEMTAEQKKLVAQFEAAQHKFLEEKEKYRKSLDSELKKIKSEISDICKAFDDKLRALQENYLGMRRSVLIQHLYELRLAEDLMDHEYLLQDRQRVERAMSELQTALHTSEKETESFSAQVEGCKDEWYRAIEDEKSCEKNFLRELEDMAGGPIDHELVKHLVELYKKRKADDLVRDSGDPKKTGAGRRGKSSQHLSHGASSNSMNTGNGGAKQRLLAEASDGSTRKLLPVTLLQNLQSTFNSSDRLEGDVSFDPFQNVEFASPPVRHGNGSGQQQQHRFTVAPLDYDVDRPDGILIEDRIWRALNTLRTRKITAEFTTKEKADQLALAKTVAEELRHQLHGLQTALQEQTLVHGTITQQLTVLAENSPLLVHIKQGQDETKCSAGDDDFFWHAADAQLVARSSVESLNDIIQLHGKDQVGILSKIKNFRKNINIMEWEHTYLAMQAVDMEERYTDIQLLRVTKDLQELFHTGDTSERQQREIALLEKKMVHVGKNHQTNLIKIHQAQAKLARQLRDRQRENDGFQAQVQQLAMQVQIREDILASRRNAAMRNAAGAHDGGSSENATRLNAITVRRKLVDLARSQTEEIEHLRLELDKMRRRTFPSFAQQQAAREYHPDSQY